MSRDDADLGTRLPLRRAPRAGLASEVPAARRAAEVHRTIGPVWTERGRPRAGFYTKRTAQAWLRDLLEQVRAGVLPGMVRTGVTFAELLGSAAAGEPVFVAA